MNFILQPTIETKRLILSPFKESDLQDIFEYASSDEVTKYTLWQTHKSIEDSKAFLSWIKAVTKTTPGQLFFVFSIRLKTTNKVIGSIDFKNTHRLAGQVDYAISKDYWNQGFVSEAVIAIREWAFNTFTDFVRLQSYCVPENVGSRRVMEKAGLQYEGLRKKSIIIKEQVKDLVYYAIVK